MQILRKLLTNLGDVWNKLPKEVPLLKIRKGAGIHSLVTVDEGVLYLHSVPFRSGLPVKQSIALKSMTTQELLDIMGSMGYVAEITSEAHEAGLDAYRPFILMEVKDVPLTSTLTVFTSNLWRTMYPIYRVLRQADFDTSEALKQLYRDMADGEWLDFWASFFSISREPGERDGNFIRRFTMWLFNPKTNNIALKELLAYRLQDTNIEVQETDQPLAFELVVGIKYIDDASALHKILREAKAAGVEYFLNYLAPTYSEDYRVYKADATGTPWENSDEFMPHVMKLLAEIFPAPSEARGLGGIIRALAETYPEPSEVRYMEVIRALSDAYGTPTEILSQRSLQSASEEQYEGATEVATVRIAAPHADAYELPKSSVETSFELMTSELNNPTEGVDELFDSNGAQDVAIATITIGGTVISTRYL